MTPQEQKTPKGEERYLLVELSCKDRRCSPCTYPNCQRFARTVPKKKPFETRLTKMFEIKKPIAKPQDTRERFILIELSCKDKKCSPCTYPNCQRFARETLKKAPFKVKVTEIESGKEVQSLLAK
ncbi:MAG TPA: hypothetical protein VGB78_11360 [Thermoplasmata archaeon]|jgi:hypothetical protein